MKCVICGESGTKIQIVRGSGLPPMIKILCKEHKKRFKDFRRNLGK